MYCLNMILIHILVYWYTYSQTHNTWLYFSLHRVLEHIYKSTTYRGWHDSVMLYICIHQKSEYTFLTTI